MRPSAFEAWNGRGDCPIVIVSPVPSFSGGAAVGVINSASMPIRGLSKCPADIWTSGSVFAGKSGVGRCRSESAMEPLEEEQVVEQGVAGHCSSWSVKGERGEEPGPRFVRS